MNHHVDPALAYILNSWAAIEGPAPKPQRCTICEKAPPIQGMRFCLDCFSYEVDLMCLCAGRPKPHQIRTQGCTLTKPAPLCAACGKRCSTRVVREGFCYEYGSEHGYCDLGATIESRCCRATVIRSDTGKEVEE